MNANIPVLPIAGGALVRAFASLLALLTHWLRQIARARRHRREASVLAGLDRHMLADIGITRCRSARRLLGAVLGRPDRAAARARDRAAPVPRHARARREPIDVENGFHRPPTDRPARQAI